MVNFAAISQGYNDRNDSNRNKRLEVMKLFEEFKRNNPYATMADFQSFRDQVSGGRNYLQGGVGNDESLRRIVQTNEAKRQQEERAVQNQEDIQKLDFIKRLEPFVQNELLNMGKIGDGKNTDKEYDYAGAATNIKNMFGGTMPFDLDLTNILSEPNRAKAVQTKVLEMTPQAQTYINSLTDPNDANAKDFASMFNLPEGVATQLLDSAKDSYNSTRQEQVQAIGNDAFDKLMLSAEKYGANFSEAVKSLDKKYGNNELYAEWKGKSLDDLESDFKKIQSGVVDQTVQQAKIRAETVMDSNEGKILAIINDLGDSDAARQRVKELINGKLTDIERLELSDDFHTSEFDSYVTQLQEIQDGQYTAIQANQKAVNRTLPDQLRETATARIKAYYDGKDGTFKNDPEVMAAALEMSRFFHIDDNALDIIGSVGKEIAGDKNMIVGDKRNVLIKALTDAGQMTFDEYKAQQVELSNAAGGLREPQTFDKYYSSRFTEATEITDQADKLIDDTLDLNITTKEKIAKLVDLKERTKSEVLHWNKVTDQDYKTSIGTVTGDSKYIWLDPTTPWNQEKIDDLSANVQKNNKRIDEQIQKLQERLKAEEDANIVSPTNTTNTNSPVPTNSNTTLPANSAFIATTILEELENGSGSTSPFSTIQDRIDFNKSNLNTKRQNMLSLLEDPLAIENAMRLLKTQISKLENKPSKRGRSDDLKKVLQNLEDYFQTLN